MLVLLALVWETDAADAVSPADRSATAAFLHAAYAFDKALLTNDDASITAGKSYAARLASECPSAIDSTFVRSLEQPTGPQESLGPRRRGELERQQSQLVDLRLELSQELLSVILAPDREALTTFESAVATLHWSNPRVAQLVSEGIASLQYEIVPGSGSLCTDIRAWVTSGYRTLDAGTRDAEHRFDSLIATSLQGSLATTEPSLTELLKRYEGRHERALAQQVETLSGDFGRRSRQTGKLRPGQPLGLIEEEVKPTGTVVGSGRTLADSEYVVRVERLPPEVSGCRFEASIETSGAPGLVVGSFTDSISVDASGSCTSRAGGSSIEASCEGDAVSVEYRTPPAVRRVRIRLSDGSTHTSRVVLVPRRLGGPAGIYYQAVPSGSAHPVSLTLLDASGRALRVVRVTGAAHCGSEPHTESEPTLAQASTPDGASYTIQAAGGQLTSHGRISLRATPGSASGFPILKGESGRAGQLNWNLSASCEPAGGIAYGLLSDRTEQVLARTAAGLTALSVAPVPARLHAGGVLVYGAFSELPQELVVRNATGVTVATVSLAEQDREASEYCAGYDEAPAG